MGLIALTCRDKIHRYPEETVIVSSVLTDIGKDKLPVKLGPLEAAEVKTLIEDLDKVYDSREHESIAVAVAEEIDAIITAVRLVNAETRAGYGSMTNGGTALDAVPLRGVHVGTATITNNANTASKGLYAGTISAVYDWIKSWTAGTSQILYPSQAMAKEAAILWLGFIDTVAIPKVDGVKFTLNNVDTAVQSLKFNHRHAHSDIDTSFVKLKKPVLFAPRKTCALTLYPNISGDSKVEPVALLITMAQNLTA